MESTSDPAQFFIARRTSNSASNRAGHISPFVFVFCEYVFQCICALCSVLNQPGHISPPPPQLSVLPPLLPLSQAIILCSAKSTKLTPTNGRKCTHIHKRLFYWRAGWQSLYFTAHPLTPLNPGVSALLLRCNATFYVGEGALFYVGGRRVHCKLDSSEIG